MKATITKNRLVRRALRVSLGASLIAAMGLAAPAQARPSHEVFTYFYADPEFSVLVGVRHVQCSMPYIVMTGTTSAYSFTEDLDPCY